MRKLVFCVIGTALVAGCLSAGVPARAQSKDEQEIRALEDQFAACQCQGSGRDHEGVRAGQ